MVRGYRILSSPALPRLFIEAAEMRWNVMETEIPGSENEARRFEFSKVASGVKASLRQISR